MKKIISSVLSVVVLFSVCGVCLASSETPSGTALEGTYVTVNENTVETSESVVYEDESIKSDLHIMSGDSEAMSTSSAGGVISKLQKALAGVGIGSAGILITIGLGLLLLL